MSDAASRPVSPLIEREPQLERLVATAAGPPALIALEGEAGTGKTRLLDEMVARRELGHLRTLRSRCHQSRQPVELAPLVEALASVRELPRLVDLPPIAGALRALLPEWDHLLPAPPPASGDPLVKRHVLARAILAIVSQLGPCLLMVEDAQWADAATAESSPCSPAKNFYPAGPPPGAQPRLGGPGDREVDAPQRAHRVALRLEGPRSGSSPLVAVVLPAAAY